MTIPDIEQIAAYNRKMPVHSQTIEWILYYCISSLYKEYSAQKITKEEAAIRKQKIITYLETLKGLAQSNSQIIRELSVLTAPRAQFPKKDKAELLDVIARIEAVVTGLIKKYDDVLPKFIRFRE